MTRRATPQPGVDRMVSTSWSGRRWSSPAARQGRASARGLEGRLPAPTSLCQGSKQFEFASSGLFFSCPQTRYLPRPLLLFVGTLRDRPGVSLFVAFGLALLFTIAPRGAPLSQTERVSGARRIDPAPVLLREGHEPAVLEIEAAVPVAVSAALLIQAPPVTNKPVTRDPPRPPPPCRLLGSRADATATGTTRRRQR